MLFFKKLFKKTRKLQFTKLRYKPFFWSALVFDAQLQETHSLDYVPESWAVVQPSGVHTHIVYDTATIFSYNEYLNLNRMFFRIKQMTIDFDMFPKMERSHEVFNEENWRMSLRRIKKQKFSILTPKRFNSFGKPFATKYNFAAFLKYITTLKPQKINFKKFNARLKKKKLFRSWRKTRRFIKTAQRKSAKIKLTFWKNMKNTVLQ